LDERALNNRTKFYTIMRCDEVDHPYTRITPLIVRGLTDPMDR
jgi:hypothetical protein